MADPIVNFFKSTLVGTYSNTDTSFTIATGDGALLPDPAVDGAFNLTIFEGLQVSNSTSFEIVRVTAKSGDVLTVTRGAESTTPLTIGSGTHSILMSATKKTFDDINTAIANVNVTTLTGVETLTFDTTGDEEFGLPTGTTAQRPASPNAGYMRWNSTDSRIEFYNGTRWAGLSEIGLQYETMQVAQLSVTANDAVASSGVNVEYLVIAGGGGGGSFAAGGGGGAGGYRSSVSGESSGGGASAESVFEADLSTSYTVTVGAGGSGGLSTASTNGSNSVFSTITSNGGGHGGDTKPIANPANPASGGSGGGGGNRTQTGASGTSNQGYGGGDANEDGPSPLGWFGGGGGGASEAGQNATTSIAGDGGDGVSSSITGSATTRAGGGGGGNHTSGGASGGSGGAGGGGNGGDAVAGTADSGTTNTGSGGGGAGGVAGVVAATSGNGGSGVVILKYSSNLSLVIDAGLTATTTDDGTNKVTTFTAGTDTISFS
jgi:hypothetical protein